MVEKTCDTVRRERDAEYKGTRGATPEPLKQQFVLIESILEEAGFRVLYSDDYEADDYAGSLVMKFRSQVPVVVMTKDNDYLQLVNDEYNVRAWMVQAKQEKADELYEKYYGPYGLTKKDVNLPEKTFEFTAEHVFAEEGVWPEQITDLTGIQGDTSDNIAGVKGVSSAVPPLLADYGTVEAMYEAIHDAEKDKKQLKELQDFWKEKLGITRNQVYGILNSQKYQHFFAFVTIADRKRITKESFQKFLEGQDEYHLDPANDYEELAMEENVALANYRRKKLAQTGERGMNGNLQYLTIDEAAFMAKVSRSMINVWYTKGYFPVVKIRNHVRIKRKEFEAWLEKRNTERGC